MKFGPRKWIGLTLLVVWVGAVVLALSRWDESWISGLTLIGIGVVGLVGAQSVVLQNRAAARDDKLAARMARLRDSLRLQLNESRRIRSLIEEYSGRTRAGEVSVREEVGALSEGVQQLRSDLEWLEEILAAINQNLSSLKTDMISQVGEFQRSARQDRSELRKELHRIRGSEDGGSLGPTRLRVVAARPRWSEGTYSSRRVNALLAGMGESDTAYLEIGVAAGKTFEAVRARRRVGVEPIPKFDVTNLPDNVTMYVGDSDNFFDQLVPAESFDIVFVDGLHEFQQTYRDLINALNHLSDGGYVLVDDVVPSDAVSAIPDLTRSLDERKAQGLSGRPWHGDVYKVVLVLRDHHPQLRFNTIVGTGNEQMILWWRDRSEGIGAVPYATLEQYRTVAYEDVFSEGIPTWFSPVDEDAGIINALKAYERRRP